ncbi:MAG: hypothetical protein K8J09_17245 [Planctomycetes bacterium]|nr:hypothetical protein [Planctomycetota bacterium]MCC7397570.1 hypothetical protein [Planctomycetota bacterium]
MRRYEVSSYRKHKRPDGWGSLCPDRVGLVEAQHLLDSGVECDGAIYNVDDEYCYRAQCHGTERDETTLWHGHPIPWQRLPSAARKELERVGRLSPSLYRKALRKRWGEEFEP